MSLLREIQVAVVQDDTDIGPLLLKLRLLAARLGSAPLEEWVKHESEGYRPTQPVPDYRVLSVSHAGTFSGPFGSGIQNAPIPPYLIEKFAGKQWVEYELRQSISAVDDLIKSSSSASGSLTLEASNLILLLQGKVYPEYACNSVMATISRAQLVELRHAVRARILELTISLEKSIPTSTDIALDSTTAAHVNSDRVTQITNQVIYGNMTSITSNGAGSTLNIEVLQGDQKSFVEALAEAGISDKDAQDLGKIVASEQPESKDEPLGSKAKSWIVQNLEKAASGAWKIGVTVATDAIKEAALRYYGLK